MDCTRIYRSDEKKKKRKDVDTYGTVDIIK